MAMYIILSTVLPEAKALGTKLNLGSAFLHYGGYMNLKKPMSIEEQIEKIGKLKIVISDEEAVKRILEEISYYRLTGYALQYQQVKIVVNMLKRFPLIISAAFINLIRNLGVCLENT